MTKERYNFVKWFSEISKKDIKLVGGKGANLGEMYNEGFPVPSGFVVTSEAYEFFLRESGLKEKIYDILKFLNIENTQELEETSKKINEMIEKANMPEILEEEILDAYDILSTSDSLFITNNLITTSILKTSKENVFVAIRSSATAEDTIKASFAGQNETFLNVKGKYEVINHIKKCFASLFTSRSIYYRIKKGFKHEDVLIAVIVQKMVNSDKSGVMFSRNPINPEDNNIIIEAVYGLGEGIVSGKISPDKYVVSRDLNILEQIIGNKKIEITRNSEGKNIIIQLNEKKAKSKVLTDDEIKKLAEYAIKLEKHYNQPQDIEFAIDSNEIYIVQTRPITTIGKIETTKKISEGKVILSGFGVSPGIGIGKVKIVNTLKDLEKIEKGDILVTKMTNPDMVVTMQKCSAIITDEGGLTCHAAIVSREMGIPAVVGTEKATSILKEDLIVTVDGFTGKIYEGKAKEEIKVEIKEVVKTKTKIKVGIDLPSFAERASKTSCKEVGLLRLEGIIAESGKHPFYFLKNNKIDEYEKIIFKGISEIAKYFDEIWIRTSDIRSDEYNNLEGAPKEKENNPMLGLHGIRASLKYKEILKAEIKAMLELSKNKIIGILLPQVIKVEEIKEFKKILYSLTTNEIKNIKLGIMIETPASTQIIYDLCKEGIDFISFGTNDLTQYTLAVDRNNENVQYLYDEMHPAILKQLAYVISVCKKYKVETSICGQAANNEKMVEFLIKHGIDSLTVTPDKAYEISKFVLDLEKKGLKGISLKTKRFKLKFMAKKKELENKEKLEKKEEDKKLEEKKEEGKQEEWPDLDLGIDIFNSDLK
ncbi:MAG: phosphoenolpyruvate synthase [Candidatus Pacearchaeota archaeon]